MTITWSKSYIGEYLGDVNIHASNSVGQTLADFAE